MRLTSIIALLTLFTLFAIDTPARGGRTISVAVHKEQVVPRAGFKIRFVEMVEDSRCPADVNCVWAGNAKIKIEVRRGRNGKKTFELNSATAPTVVKYAGYDIKLVDLTPHPRSDIRINPDGYVARFEIKRSGK